MSTAGNMIKNILGRWNAFEKHDIFADKRVFDGKLPSLMTQWAKELIEADKIKSDVTKQSDQVDKLYRDIEVAKDVYGDFARQGSFALQQAFINFSAPLSNREKAARDNNRALWVKLKKTHPEFDKMKKKPKMDFGPTLEAYAKAWGKQKETEQDFKVALSEENITYQKLVTTSANYRRGVQEKKMPGKVLDYFNKIIEDIGEEHEQVRKNS